MVNEIFQDEIEIKRLMVQNRLLAEYEEPVLDDAFNGKSDLFVLDVGSNDGKKTIKRFAERSVKKLIGLEYNAELVEKAKNEFDDKRFSFYCCDADSDDFESVLIDICRHNEIEKFDIIYLSFVLMHMSSPERLLELVKRFLKIDGKVIIIEGYDSNSSLVPDKDNRLIEFLDYLDKDPFSGNRALGKKLPQMLRDSGFSQITSAVDSIAAEGDEIQKKRDIFEVFFSYFPQDISILIRENPEDEYASTVQKWIDTYYDELKNHILDKESKITMGLRVVVCEQ